MTGTRTKLVFALFALAIITLLAMLRLSDPSAVATLRDAYFDQLQRMSPREAPALPVRVVDIDEVSLARHGQWPWPRHILATLNERLAEMGASVVTYDVLFAETDRLSASRLLDDPFVEKRVRGATWLSNLDELDYDLIFSRSMQALPVVLGVSDAGASGAAPLAGKAGFVEIGGGGQSAFELRSATAIVPELYDAAAGVGNINVSPSVADGVIREVPLVWKTEDGFLPSLALESLRVAMQESTILLRSDATDTGLETIGLAGYDIPVNERGLFRLHYRPDDPDLYVSAHSVLDPSLSASVAPRIEGHIVLVGTSAAGLLDIRTTTLGESVPGVSIHAQILEQILVDRYLNRTVFQDASELAIFIAICFAVFLTLVLFGPITSVLIGGLAGGATFWTSWHLFTKNGILLDVTFPLVAGFVVFFALTVFRFAVLDREKRLIRNSFSKYVAPSILGKIEASGHDLKLGGDMTDVTVMFTDIREFTPLSASMSAQELVALLNELFTDLTAEILDAKGTVDKYIGDSIMAFWNAPVAVENHEHLACISALKMRDRLDAFSRKRVAAGLAPVRMATGLATGRACVGNMGSRDHFNYSVVGDVVNEAARIEAACRRVHYDIVASSDVVSRASGLATLYAGALQLKGVAQRIETYLIVGSGAMAGTKAFQDLAEAHQSLVGKLENGGDALVDIERCRTLAIAIDPNLTGFYNVILDNRADFLSQTRLEKSA